MSNFDFSGLSVLLVDDVNFSLETVTRQMAGHGLKRIHHAKNGAEGLEILSDSTAEVKFVISDFNMPVMHGLEFLKAVRCGDHGIGRSMPFALLTRHADKHLVDMALALDVNAFLVKPMSKKGLETRLGKMLRQTISESWLKPVDIYETVNIDLALAGIRMPETAPGPPKSRGVYVDGARKSAISSGSADEHRVNLDSIHDNVVLSRDVFADNGRLLLATGVELTPRTISVLVDLRDLGQPISDIWVKS